MYIHFKNFGGKGTLANLVAIHQILFANFHNFYSIAYGFTFTHAPVTLLTVIIMNNIMFKYKKLYGLLFMAIISPSRIATLLTVLYQILFYV